MRRRATAVAVLAAALACATPAHAAETILATEPHDTPVALYHGVAAWWSTQPSGRGRLMIYQDARARPAPVPSVGFPNDLDLGPDAEGRITAVYSRCSHPATGAGVQMGCRLYRYALGGQEQRIRHVSRTGYSEHDPTIWRSRIAYARFRDADEAPVDRIYLDEGRRNRQLPRGTYRPDDALGAPRAQATRLDMRGDRLAFSWYYPLAICGPIDPTDPWVPTKSEVWLVNIATRRSRRLAHGCSDDDTGVLGTSLQPDGVWYVRGLDEGPFMQHRADFAGTPTSNSAIGSVTYAYARDGASTLSVRQVLNPDPNGTPRIVFQVVLAAGDEDRAL